MTKYVIAILVFIAALAAFLLYIGNEAQLILRSTSDKTPLNFGEVKLTWQFATVIITLGILGFLGLWTFLGWLWRMPSRLKSGAGLRRRNKALDAMEEALIAGAEGDKVKARRRAEKARGLIGSAALGRIVSAQAAEASGDTEEAIDHYTAMLEDEKTVATAQRGLAQQFLATGNLNGAIEHASKAYADNKNARWAFDTLFQAQVSDHRWADALETLKLAETRKHTDKDIARRRRAVLMTAEADRLNNNAQSDAASEMAVSAASASPEFAPAVALAASLLSKAGEGKKAAGLIEKAWAKAPHPALGLAFQDIYSAESEKTRAKRVSQLIRTNPDHRESLILKAEQALATHNGVDAWSALSPLMTQDGSTARLCILAAQAETMLKNSSDAAVWTERAATAPCEADWSDLDPQGEAFEYTDQDWRRLVFSYGEKGELIHPRFESGAARRSVKMSTAAKPVLVSSDISQDASAETPSQTVSSEKDDLGVRLDSLLDGESNKTS